VFLKCWDEHEHHSVILRYAAAYGLEHLGFKVERAADLEECERAVEKYGGRVTRHGRGELAPGHGEAIRFDTPTGHRCELVWGMEKVGNLLPRTNPPPRPLGLVGIASPRLDHVFVTAEDVEEGTRFFRDVLGFRLTEQIVADDGHQLATWLERSHSPHDIALVTGPNGGLHHCVLGTSFDSARSNFDSQGFKERRSFRRHSWHSRYSAVDREVGRWM
jgi:catechol 2,3-dioxygenase